MTAPASLSPVYVPAALVEAIPAAELTHVLQRYLTEKAVYARRGVSYGTLTSQLAAPVVAPVAVRFRDANGQWITGLSEPKIDPNHWRIDLSVKGYAPCARKAHWGRTCGCQKKLVGMREGPANLCTNVFANHVRVGILGTNTTVTDATGAGRALTKTMDGGINSLLGCAGTGGTAATVADTNMQTQTETQASVTVNTVTGSGATGTFTVTFVITATADRAYQEVGIKNVTTTNAWNFLVTHDSFSVLNVSSSGTLSVTYTFTNS